MEEYNQGNIPVSLGISQKNKRNKINLLQSCKEIYILVVPYLPEFVVRIERESKSFSKRILGKIFSEYAAELKEGSFLLWLEH